jgi:hypothetical protein
LEELLADVFREVDEELRHEHYAKLWQKYGRYVIVLAVFVVVGTAANVGWREYVRAAREADGAQFAAAVELFVAGKSSEAATAFAGLVADGGDGYPTLAALQQAAALASGGDQQGAIAIYDRLAKTAESDLLQGLARLLGALSALDGAAVGEVERRLVPLLAGQSPWRYSAREVAALAAQQGGKLDEAKKLFTELADDAGAPAGIRARAAEMLAALDGAS